MMWCIYNEKTLYLYGTAFTKPAAKDLQATWRRWANQSASMCDKHRAKDIGLIKQDQLNAWRILKEAK